MAQSQQKMGGKRWFCGWYKEVTGNPMTCQTINNSAKTDRLMPTQIAEYLILPNTQSTPTTQQVDTGQSITEQSFL